MAIVTRESRPLSVKISEASPFEITLVKATIRERFIKPKIKRLTGDRAYDSDPLDKELKSRGIELNAPHKRNRKKKSTQDGRKLKHYKRRWVVERFFAGLQNFKRCVIRYDGTSY